jgi:hypothetical protein
MTIAASTNSHVPVMLLLLLVLLLPLVDFQSGSNHAMSHLCS